MSQLKEKKKEETKEPEKEKKRNQKRKFLMKFGLLGQLKRNPSRLWKNTKQKQKNMKKRTRLIVVGEEEDVEVDSVTLEVVVVEVEVAMVDMEDIKIVLVTISGNTILVDIGILTVQNEGTLILAPQVQRDGDMTSIPELWLRFTQFRMHLGTALITLRLMFTNIPLFLRINLVDHHTLSHINDRSNRPLRGAPLVDLHVADIKQRLVRLFKNRDSMWQ